MPNPQYRWADIVLKNEWCSNEFAVFPEFTKLRLVITEVRSYMRGRDFIRSFMYYSINIPLFVRQYKLLVNVDPEEESPFIVNRGKSFIIIEKDSVYFSFTDKLNSIPTEIHTEKTTLENIIKAIDNNPLNKGKIR